MTHARIHDPVAVVTGGTSGIGRGIAERLVRDGVNVLIGSRRQDGPEIAAEIAADSGGAVEFAELDVTRRDDVRGFLAACEARFGPPGIAVASAGVSPGAEFLDLDDERWRTVLDVNLYGAFVLVQEAARRMVSHRQPGAIVVLASTNAFSVESSMTAYNVSKAGTVALVRSAALELAEHGIRVNAVGPGLIDTPMTSGTVESPANAAHYLEAIPARRFGSPEEVAAAVAFLTSRDAAYITGHHLIVDGGQTVGLAIPPDSVEKGAPGR